MARQLLAGAPVVYNGDPLRDLSLVNFLDAFVQRKPRVCPLPALNCYSSHSHLPKICNRQHIAEGQVIAYRARPAAKSLLPSIELSLCCNQFLTGY